MRVFVTGCSSHLAQVLLPMLCERVDVSEVVGIDKAPCRFTHEKFSSSVVDIHAPEMPGLMRGADAVVHLAFGVMQGKMTDAELRHNNVDGTLKVFGAAASLRIGKVVNMSSVSVYGAGENLDESAPLVPSALFTYARHKAEIEREAAERFPNVIHLRSHLIFGRHCQGFLRDMVRARAYIAPRAPWPPVQVIHEVDVAQAVLLALTSDVQGAFNLAAPEVTSLPELVRQGRRHVYPIPLGVIRTLVSLARLFGNRDEFTWLDVLDTGLTVRCDKAGQLLGWRPEYSAWQARDAALSG